MWVPEGSRGFMTVPCLLACVAGCSWGTVLSLGTVASRIQWGGMRQGGCLHPRFSLDAHSHTLYPDVTPKMTPRQGPVPSESGTQQSCPHCLRVLMSRGAKLAGTLHLVGPFPDPGGNSDCALHRGLGRLSPGSVEMAVGTVKGGGLWLSPRLWFELSDLHPESPVPAGLPIKAHTLCLLPQCHRRP